MSTMLFYLKKPATYATLGVVAFILILSALTRGKPTQQIIAVERKTLTQEVIVTGKTKPGEDVSLGFEKSGRVRAVYAQLGDRVTAGQILAVLTNGDLAANLAQANAEADIKRAKLDELLRGSRPEEIRIAEAKVNGSKASLSDAKEKTIISITDAYASADDAVRNQADPLFSGPKSASPKLIITSSDPQLKIDTELERLILEKILTDWAKELKDINNAKSNLNTVKSFFTKLASIVNGAGPSTGISQTAIDGYKTAVSAARTDVDSAYSALSASAEALKIAESNLAVAEEELNLENAGATSEQIAAARAEVAASEAKIQGAGAEVAKTIIRAPIDGLLTRVDVKPGEIAAANTALLAVYAEGAYEIEANVPEVDIGKLGIGNPVKITLDAFPGEEFRGKVVDIDPAETIVDGVVNFKATIAFDAPDGRIKSGLTANLAIETVKKTGVLAIPQSTIIENDNGVFVERFENGKAKEVPVGIGIRSQDGLVEIVSGLAEIDKVINIGFKGAGAK